MLTFNNSEELKNELVEKTKHHQKLDAFIQEKWKGGKVGDIFRGCFIGCTMQTDENPLEKFSEHYHIDLWLPYVAECIFEGLPLEEAKLFPLQCVSSLPVGIDLNAFRSRFTHAVLTDQLKYTKEGDERNIAIKQCIELFTVPFDQISKSAAWSTASVASAASAAIVASAASVASVASAASVAGAVSVARSTVSAVSVASAASVASAVRSAARNAERSAVWSAEWSAESAESAAAKTNHYRWLREIFIELLKEAK